VALGLSGSLARNGPDHGFDAVFLSSEKMAVKKVLRCGSAAVLRCCGVAVLRCCSYGITAALPHRSTFFKVFLHV
jgi:hypothetical protein